MKKQKTKFILAEASINDINKQLKINSFVMIVVVSLLILNVLYFIEEKSFFSAVFIFLMVLLVFFTMKSRDILKLRAQQLNQQNKV